MKKVISVTLVSMLILSLMACMAPRKKDGIRVKCPACGYEFNLKDLQDE